MTTPLADLAPVAAPRPRRIAVLSIHTSPLDQPGTGDAGGMNVYVVETARRLAESGIEVEIFTRATSSALPPDRRDGARRHRPPRHRRPVRGPAQGGPARPAVRLHRGVLRAEAARPEGWYDLVHSHYWLSGQVGWLASERWNVPLVHSMHTHGQGQEPRPRRRRHPRAGDARHRRAAGRRGRRPAGRQHRRRGPRSSSTSTAPTPTRVDVVHPGVDLDAVHARAAWPRRAAAAASPTTPSCCCSSAASSRSRRPTSCCARPPRCSRATQPCAVASSSRSVGGPSGSGLEQPDVAGRPGRASSGIADLVRFEPPVRPVDARRLVPRGGRRGRPVVQRVVRPGRRRGAGLRHARRRRRRRRAAHRGRRPRQRAARRRPRPARLRDRHRVASPTSRGCAREMSAGAAHARGRVRLGRHHRRPR